MADSKVIRYEFKKHDPEESRRAFAELAASEDELTEIDIEDEYEAQHFGVMVHRDDKDLVEQSDGTIKIDLKNFIVKLPKEIVDSCGVTNGDIPAKQLRYCGFPWFGVDGTSRNDGRVVLLSLWTEDWLIRNVYLVAPDARSAMLLVSALTRFIFESSGKSTVRTHRFYVIVEGPVSVGFTSTEERDVRDKIRQNQAELKKREVAISGETNSSRLDIDAAFEGIASKRGESVIDKYLKPIEKTPMYAVLDEEALCLYERPFSFEPLHDFRFYREKTPNSIDTIYICQTEEQLEVQNREKVFYVYKRPGAGPEDHAAIIYTDLVETLRRGTVKPKTQTTFRGTGKDFESFFAIGFISKPFRMPSSFMPQETKKVEPKFPEPPTSAEVSKSKAPQERKYPKSAGTKEDVSTKEKFKESPPTEVWLESLISGSHLLNVSEEMQMTWFTVEADIESVIKDGKVPDIDMRSAGLDRDSVEQLQNTIEHIKDKLMDGQYAEAVSQLRGCITLYGQTLLAAIKKEREVELLKRIYFLSG
jgi:hypothetical protein